jgi:hypothetical protein
MPVPQTVSPELGPARNNSAALTPVPIPYRLQRPTAYRANNQSLLVSLLSTVALPQTFSQTTPIHHRFLPVSTSPPASRHRATIATARTVHSILPPVLLLPPSCRGFRIQVKTPSISCLGRFVESSCSRQVRPVFNLSSKHRSTHHVIQLRTPSAGSSASTPER